MGISSDMGVIALVLAGVFAYVTFLLWTPKKVLSEKPNRFFSFLIGFLCSISLSVIFLLGCVLGGILFMWLGSTASYIMGSICGILLCAYTIKTLPSKIGIRDAMDYFSVSAFAIYIILGIGELLSAPSSFSLLGDGIIDLVVTGLSNIVVALCAIAIPRYQKKSSVKPDSVQSVSPMQQAPSSVSTLKPIPSEIAPVSGSAGSVSAMKFSALPRKRFRFPISKNIITVILVIAALFIGLAVGLLLGEGYFAFKPSSPYIESVASSAYASGYLDGHLKGYDSGVAQGYDEGSEKGQSSGYSDGYSDGYGDGYSDGYGEGYDDCYYGY